VSAAREREADGHRLLLLRHAKAVPGDPASDDHERPLAARGRRDAARIGAEIERRGLEPTQVLCSSSRRTRETLELLMPHLGAGLAVVVDRSLYLAGPEEILDRIAEVRDRVHTLLVVGHHPGLAELALRLVRRSGARATARMGQKFPTGALAALRFPAGRWRDLAPHSGILDAFVAPREIAAGEA
jgi:phosphohistidine phosphatase